MPKRVTFALLLMGLTSLVTQTLLIREFLVSFAGNELTIGIILANWLLWGAVGNYLSGRLSLKVKRPLAIFAALQAGIFLYLPIGIFLIRDLHNIFGLLPAEGAGIALVFFSSFLFLMPLGISSGAQFPCGCRIFAIFSEEQERAAARAYILEALGFIFAGPLFTYLLLLNFNSFQIALLIGLLNLCSGLWLIKGETKGFWRKFLLINLSALFILGLLGLIFFSGELQKSSLRAQWKGRKLLDYRNSIYVNLAVTQSENQYTFYLNGLPAITAPLPDIAFTEEFSHFGMLTQEKAQDTLILGAGAGGIIKEVLKYPVKKVDYTELDPALIKLMAKFPTELTEAELSDARLKIHYLDGRRFVRLTQEKYDVILLNLPPPFTLQLNRYYCGEFFRDARSILKEKGVFCLALPGSLNYLGPQLRDLNGSILKTLRAVFPQVRVIPGDYNIYLAGNSEWAISAQDFLRRMSAQGIATRLISLPHLNYRLGLNWQSWFNKTMGDLSGIRDNLSLRPSAVFYSVSYWNALFSPGFEKIFQALAGINLPVALLILFLLSLLLYTKGRILRSPKAAVGFAVASTGFAAMSLNLMLIFSYQAFYGYLYSRLALLAGAFMSGLAAGAWFCTERLARAKKATPALIAIEATIVFFCLALVPLLLYLDKSRAINFNLSFFILLGLAGFFAGAEFPLANKIYQQCKESYARAAGILYGLDLAGGWLAALVTAIALIPLLGIVKTCLLLAGLKIASLILVVTGADKN